MWSIRSFGFQVSNTGTALLLDTNANTYIFSRLTWKAHPTSDSQVNVLFLQPLCWNSQLAYQQEDNGEPCSTSWKGAKKPLQFVLGWQPVLYTHARLQIHIPTKLLFHSRSHAVPVATVATWPQAVHRETQLPTDIFPPLSCSKGNSLCRGISPFYINFKN